jgi:hypothetical protein
MDGVMPADKLMGNKPVLRGADANPDTARGQTATTRIAQRRKPPWLPVVLLMLQPLPACAADWIYTVAPGDNLWVLSERYLDSPTRFEQIRRLNGIEQPSRMKPGTRLRIPMEWIRSNPVPALVAAVQGQARITRTDGSTQDSVVPGTTLRLGDRLKTGGESSVAIRFADGTLLTLHSASEMRFDHLSAHGETGMVDSRLHLIDGRLETRVRPAVGPGSRFEIQTPSAISAVRGTEYRAAVSDADRTSNVEVLEGKVEVSGARKGRLIPQGFGTQVAAGKPPIAPQRLLPPPALDALPAPVRQINWPLDWPATDGAAAYRVEISTSQDLNVLSWEQVVTRAGVALPDLPDGDYQVRIRGIDRLGLEGRSAVQSLVLDARPQPPMALLPVDRQIVRGSTAELRWSDSADADRYRLEIARDAAFEEIVEQRTDLDTTHFAAAAITEPGTYHWRVTSIAADGETGPPGAARSWQLKPPPAAVQPALAASDGRLIASWPPGRPGQTFEVQVAEDLNFEALQLEQATIEPQIGLDEVSGQVRYLRVRAVEADGYQGPWGAAQRIDPLPDRSGWFVPVLGVLGILLL